METIDHTRKKPDSLFSHVLLGFSILVLLIAAYSNHFSNDFHFDDGHTVVDNLFIRDPANIPRFFTDARTFSSMPLNQSYRPIVSLTFAVDHWLGGGLRQPVFHISTFFWFLVQFFLMIFLYKRIGETSMKSSPPVPIRTTALLASALYCLHPVGAETINYICARSDSLSTLGVIAAFVIYQYGSGWKRYALCLIPVAIGALAKPTAVMFAPMFFGYLLIIENRSWRDAAVRSLPAFIVCALLYGLITVMTPPTWVPAGGPLPMYIATQTAVWAYYVRSLFFPFWLSADTDMGIVTSLGDIQVFLGVVFLALLFSIARNALRNREDRPVAFGLLWFALALIPTTVVPLAEVANDHRMFFPYVGLVFAVVWAVHRFWETRTYSPTLLAAIWIVILPLCAYGVHVRNTVWLNAESLWEDATIKSPKNGRAWMNLGLASMAKGDYQKTRELFQRALTRSGDYFMLHVNFGILESACGNLDKAEGWFKRALSTAPDHTVPLAYYSRYLISRGKHLEAIPLLEKSLVLTPSSPQARDLLLQAYALSGQTERFSNLAKETLEMCPDNPEVREFAGRAASMTIAVVLLERSLASYREKRFESCIQLSQEALRLNPAMPEAWNNICAGHNSLGQFEDGLRAGEKALELRPDFQLAKNNLAWSRLEIASQGDAQGVKGSAAK